MLSSFSCSLLLHLFLFTNVNLRLGFADSRLSSLPGSYPQAWRLIRWGWWGFLLLNFLLSRHGVEKRKIFVLEEHNSMLVKSVVKLPL